MGMKKIFCCLLAFLLLGKGFGQPLPASGQLKITIQNIKCINRSWDGIVEFDGHGNEVSVNVSYRIYTPANPAAARRGVGGTPIFGSGINGMTKAGTQTPDLGGIANGDAVTVSRLIMDEHINQDEIIVIAPTLWEWDGPDYDNTFNRFNTQLDMDLNWAITQPYPFANTPVSYLEPFDGRVIKIFDKYQYGQAIKYHNIFKKFLCPGIGQGSKPVDILSGTFNNECMVIYPPTFLVLDTKVLSALASNNYDATRTDIPNRNKPGLITGVTIPFTEASYAITTSNGSYTVAFKIEFIPDLTVAPGTPEGKTKVVKNSSTIKMESPALSAGALNNVSSVTGRWAGTQTNDYGLYPQAIQFELTANKEFLMQDNNGAVAAKGTYTFSNNSIAGSYKLSSSGETISFVGTFNPVSRQLSVTQGSGTATTGQGKWIATKQ
jgi:hypothetical protein